MHTGTAESEEHPGAGCYAEPEFRSSCATELPADSGITEIFGRRPRVLSTLTQAVTIVEAGVAFVLRHVYDGRHPHLQYESEILIGLKKVWF